MRGLGEVLTQQQIATAGQSNADAVAQAAALAQGDDYGVSAGDLEGAWNWLTDPTGSGAGYMPTKQQLETISGQQPKPAANYWMYGALALGAYFLLAKRA